MSVCEFGDKLTWVHIPDSDLYQLRDLGSHFPSFPPYHHPYLPGCVVFSIRKQL